MANNYAEVEIRTDLMLKALGFPPGTKVRRVSGENVFRGNINVVVEHPDLPERLEGEVIPLARPVIKEELPIVTRFDWGLYGEWINRTE